MMNVESLFRSSGRRRPDSSEIYDLLQEIARHIDDKSIEMERRFVDIEAQTSTLSGKSDTNLKQLNDTVVQLEKNVLSAVGVLEGVFGAQEVRLSELDHEARKHADLLGNEARERTDLLRNEARERADLLHSQLDETRKRTDLFHSQLEALNAFIRWARQEDRRQLDSVGTIATRIDGFVHFTRADDRQQLDQIGILADNVHKQLAAVADHHKVTFERLGGAVEDLGRQVTMLLGAAATRREVIVSETPKVEAPPPKPISHQGLFVVGHARSGTSVLLTALNTSPDIFLFGEANFHFHAYLADFRSWYNQLHRENGAPHLKSSYCPEFFGRPASGMDYLRTLSAHYRWVGEKVAFGSVSEDFGFDSFSRFHEREFYDARYICVVKHPFSTLISNGVMFKSLDLRPYVRSLVKTMMKIVELSSLYPHVKVLVHEDITARTFERLSEFISTPLDAAFACYTTEKQNYVSREDAERALGHHYCDVVERVWLRFLEFYDPATLSVRECEGLLSYLLIEYREVVAAIDAELAAEAAVAAEQALKAERKLAEARGVEARMSLEIKKSASSAKASASKATTKTTASKVDAPPIKSKSKKPRDGERAAKGRPLAEPRASRIET